MAEPTTTEDCAFCEGRAAAERGEPHTANPYPQPSAPEISDEYRQSDWWLWDVGYGVGSIDWAAVKPVRRRTGGTGSDTQGGLS